MYGKPQKFVSKKMRLVILTKFAEFFYAPAQGVSGPAPRGA